MRGGGGGGGKGGRGGGGGGGGGGVKGNYESDSCWCCCLGGMQEHRSDLHAIGSEAQQHEHSNQADVLGAITMSVRAFNACLLVIHHLPEVMTLHALHLCSSPSHTQYIAPVQPPTNPHIPLETPCTMCSSPHHTHTHTQARTHRAWLLTCTVICSHCTPKASTCSSSCLRLQTEASSCCTWPFSLCPSPIRLCLST